MIVYTSKYAANLIKAGHFSTIAKIAHSVRTTNCHVTRNASYVGTSLSVDTTRRMNAQYSSGFNTTAQDTHILVSSRNSHGCIFEIQIGNRALQG